MKRPKLNLIIDVIMLIVMMALIGVGLLNKYVLLSGQKKWAKYGENLDLSLFGLDRHGWNTIHFILGIVLFGLLVLHIWFHWNMVVCIYQTMIKNRKARIVSAIALLVVSIVLVVFPFFIDAKTGGTDGYVEGHDSGRNKDTGGRQGQHLPDTEHLNIENLVNDSIQIFRPENNEIENLREEVHSTSNHSDVNKEEHHYIPANIEVMGNMTLNNIAEEYNVPIDSIKNKLKIPQSTSNYERLGRLRRAHGFTMSEIEQIIYDFQKKDLDN